MSMPKHKHNTSAQRFACFGYGKRKSFCSCAICVSSAPLLMLLGQSCLLLFPWFCCVSSWHVTMLGLLSSPLFFLRNAKPKTVPLLALKSKNEVISWMKSWVSLRRLVLKCNDNVCTILDWWLIRYTHIRWTDKIYLWSWKERLYVAASLSQFTSESEWLSQGDKWMIQLCCDSALCSCWALGQPATQRGHRQTRSSLQHSDSDDSC